ncbi:uncharacterized protein EV420DRAFT_1588214 [Desarmillaria tabescens]|uniref:Uncharacterized protein n=1 Tax=Armillaria tabescens TaxID=1929756 RepID=A0AA39J788_ARMTA|nr:uncharacterized protein EV420DRAFT_1588214 [Desarmillaria tabescens]KAK0437436.1 hypothetical protein EV420DRAFT_1588214 [Desarmillaria tabescens]
MGEIVYLGLPAFLCLAFATYQPFAWILEFSISVTSGMCAYGDSNFDGLAISSLAEPNISTLSWLAFVENGR